MMNIRKHRILVLDADMVPALTIARALSRRACVVDVASHTSRPLSSYSNAVSACHQYPDPLISPEAFVAWLIEHVDSRHYDLVIPVTERTLIALSARRALVHGINVAMPTSHSLDVVLDKSKTMALADTVGVPRPMGMSISSLNELAELQGTLSYPLVLKPARSIGSAEGGATQLQVSYAFSAAELASGCAAALRFGPVLLQELFPGVGVGIELIARRGKIAYAFQHLRLHEVPLTGGGSSLRKSEPLAPELLAASERLIEALQWNGVAMVEFKLDLETRRFCLMEINGRFWGSLPLAIAAGADFPSMLLDLELNDAIRPCAPYRNDVYCRLLSRDLQWYEAVLRSEADTRIISIPGTWEVFRGLADFLRVRHYFDVQSLRDPMPGLVDVGRIFESYRQRLLALLHERKFFAQQRRAWKTGEVATTLAEANSILFLCYGNINRSALADAMVRGYAEDSGISVASCGFHPEERRPADPVMVEVARHFGTEMGHVQSACVTPQLIRQSDIIFVMEKSHYDRVLAMDGSVASRMFLLGAHSATAGRSVEIADPYGRARELYVACHVRIAEAIDNLKAVIALRASD
jgi:protein-tyrosine-phosphatase/predicted ATP-grasp superfamily ATP-dependent carboligase